MQYHVPDTRKRCGWSSTDPVYIQYHDTEWGYPVHDDRKQFEFLLLESFQAGLSWLTILKKRENFRNAFAGFDPKRVAGFGNREIDRCMKDSGIIRNGLKIRAAVSNARAMIEVVKEHGSFDEFLWEFVGGRQKVNNWRTLRQIPAESEESVRMSRALAEKGFKFVGPVICYSHMQATGMVNDHVKTCFRHDECLLQSD